MEMFQLNFTITTVVLISSLVSLLIMKTLMIQPKSPKSPKNLPPSPPSLPVIGHLHHLAGGLVHEGLTKLSKTYGPIFSLKLGQVPAVAISSREAAKEVLKILDPACADRPESIAVKTLFYNSTNIGFCAYGEYWRQMRKICALEMLSANNVRSFGYIRQDEGDTLVKSLKLVSGKTINLTENIFVFSCTVTCRATFGNVMTDRDAFIVLVRKIATMTGGMEFWYFKKYAQFSVHEFYAIQEMFAAGTKSSATTTDWAMAELVRNPRVMAKVQSEIREALKGKTTVQESDVQGLTYLKLVIKETLRLHPSFPMLPRQCKDEIKVDGYTIPVKTKVMINVWAMARDPKYWEDAESFKPERFENSTIDFLGNDYEFLPFGAGKRICPGQSFGIANIELPLTQLLFHFDWKLPQGMNLDDVDMAALDGLAVLRKTPLVLIPTIRNPSN